MHFHYIGYFDPPRHIDLSVKPYRPLPVRPIPSDLVAQLAERFGVELGGYVVDMGGYLFSDLGTAQVGQLHPFEAAFVSQGCVILNEAFVVIQPIEAVKAYFSEFVVERRGSGPEPERERSTD